MPNVELVFFSNCPSVPRARQAILDSGNLVFQETNIDALDASDPRRRLSSPSILVNGKLAIGSESGAAACSYIDWVNAASKIRDLTAYKHGGGSR